MTGRAPTSSSFKYIFTYDVFLNFRGEDTCHGFTGSLYRALTQKGVRTFFDDGEIRKGDEITPTLHRAIEESRMFICVFSKDYASSTFCLDELVKIHQCIKKNGRLVWPIFYDVDPSEVRHQKGNYGQALTMHKQNLTVDEEKMKSWRLALHEVANISGIHLNPRYDYEYKIIERIVKEISRIINRVPLYIAEYPVGLDTRLQKVNSLLQSVSHDEVIMVGICGIRGSGKTTLARIVYNSIADNFEGLCFLHDIKENSRKLGLERMQERMLSKILGVDIKIDDVNEGVAILKERLRQKKVLLILDNVDEQEQLQIFVGHCDWFGFGSRIIITTRYKHLLIRHGVEQIYEMEALTGEESLELLSWNAFKSTQIDPSYKEVVNRMTCYARGLPLALKLIGSSLFGMSINEWQYAIDVITGILHKDVQRICHESPKEPRKGSTLWLHKDIMHVLEENTKAPDLRVLNLEKCQHVTQIPNLSSLENLKELRLQYCKNLIAIDDSVGKLPQLQVLDVSRCAQLETFPGGIKSPYLEQLHLGGCSSLKYFPEIKVKVQLTKLELWGTGIEKLPSSISNFTRLEKITIREKIDPPNIHFLLPERENSDEGYGRLLTKAIIFPNLMGVNLQERNISSSKSLQMYLSWFSNMRMLNLSNNDFTILPACIKECHFLLVLNLNGCRHLREVEGIPPNIKELDATDCISLSSKSRNLLLSKELIGAALIRDVEYVPLCKEDQDICFIVPRSSIPEWLDHYRKGSSISFWFRNSFPSLCLCALVKSNYDKAIYHAEVVINGKPTSTILSHDEFWLDSKSDEDHIIVYGLRGNYFREDYKMIYGFQAGAWHYAKVIFSSMKEDSVKENGIYVMKQHYNMEDIRFTYPDLNLGFKNIDQEQCENSDEGYGKLLTKVMLVPNLTTSIEKLPSGICNLARTGCKKDLDASSARIRHEAESSEDATKFENDDMPSNFEHLVGDIQSKVGTIISLLEKGCFIGISGMSGIGKTTLARLVYDAIRSEFEATCFLENVRWDSKRVGIVSLQKKLLSELGLGERDIVDSSQGENIIRKFLCDKKVLIFLDDVSEKSQLEKLVGHEEWFGVGSKIVITTRDRTPLTLYEQFEEYEVGRLHPDESLKLLCKEAFKKDEPEQGYLDLSTKVIEYACGLPLVLKVLGSFLHMKDKYEWRNASERLRQDLPIDIHCPLRISYDGLEDEELKTIFLDIACFFNRETKFKVTNILKLSGLHSTRGIEVLIAKSMLNFTHSNSKLRQNAKEDQDMLDRILRRRDVFLPTYMYDWLLQEASKEYLYMHDLLQEMGRNIVMEESPINTGTPSRLWRQEDINDVLKENKGTGNVQSIVLCVEQSFEADWHPDCFSNMQELRLLDLSKVHLSCNLNSLPSALKIMRWDYYPLESLPPVDQLHELESLQLCNSKIRKLWNGAPVLEKLRIIDLSNSECLDETPNFKGTPNLEELLLKRCRKLVQVHESVGQLKKLVKLRLEHCRNLTTLPTYLEMDKLEEFILSGCLKLEKLPEFGKNMGSLYFLDVRGTDITEIPLSIVHLTNLKYLDLTFCSRLRSIPKLPPNLIISASNCRLLEPISALRHLYASYAPKGPIHLFYDFQLRARIPTLFERWEYCWGKDTSSEFVTITADIPSNVGDYEKQCWGIAVCVVFQFLSQAWLGFSIDWEFKDSCRPNKTKIHGTPAYCMHDCRVYLGFYPFEAKDCRQHPSGEGKQLDLTLDFPATNITNDLHDLEIVGCGWCLICKNDFDAWRENRGPSPPRLGSLIG